MNQCIKNCFADCIFWERIMFYSCNVVVRDFGSQVFCIKQIDYTVSLNHYKNIIHYADINQKYQNIQICISWISKDLATIVK